MKIASKVAREFLHRQAGGSSFGEFVKGSNLNQAYEQLQASHRREHGEGAYSGSVAAKRGVILRKPTPMTMDEARDFIETDIDDNDKWGSSYAVAIAEEVEGATKKVTVEVEADNEWDAKKQAAAKARLTPPSGTGSVWTVKDSKPTRQKVKGKLELIKEPADGAAFYKVVQKNGSDLRGIDGSPSKSEAIKKLQDLIQKAPEIARTTDWNKDPFFVLVQVKPIMKIKVPGAATGAPKWDVEVTMVSVKKGPIKGYYFYGWVST